MARDFSKMSPEELEAIYQTNFGQNRQVQQSQQPQGGVATQPQPDINSLLNRITGNQSTGQRLLRGGANALSILGGGQPKDPQSDLTNDLVKTILGESVKKSFETDEEKLIRRANAIKAAKETGNRALYDSLVGNTQSQSNLPIQDEQEQADFQAPEIDPFTGKLSARGVGQDFSNKMIQQQGLQDIKSKSPTAKQKDDLANIGNVETLLLNMEKDASMVPSGYKGLLSQAGGFFTRGATNTSTVVYNDQRKAVAVAVYRALTGDTRLSDADAAARALPLLWKPDEAQEVKTMKFQKLRQLLSDRKQVVSQNLGGREEGIQDPNDFSQMSDEELQQIASSA